MSFIAIAIGIALFVFQKISCFLFSFSDAGIDSAAAPHNHAFETSVLATPSATLKSKAAPVTPYVSVFSPLMARISPYKYSPMHFLTTHLTAPLPQPAMSFNKPPLPRRSTSQTSTRSTHVSTRTQLAEKPKPAAKPRLLATTDYNNAQPAIKCFVVQTNHTKPKIRTSTKPQIPKLSPTVSQFLQTRTPNAKQPKPHLLYGTDNKNTKSAKKHLVSEVNDTKPTICASSKPQNPRLSATVSQFIETRTKLTSKGKPVNTPPVAESVTKPFIADGNNTKPKMLPSRKPPRPIAPVSQAKPAKKAPSVDGTDKNYTKSTTKPFIAAGNNTKPCRVAVGTDKNYTKSTTKPFIADGNDTKPRRVAVGTDNGTKPKVLISTKPPRPPLSTRTTHIKVTPKDCLQRWR